mgnify:CR=1 FL=1
MQLHFTPFLSITCFFDIFCLQPLHIPKNLPKFVSGWRFSGSAGVIICLDNTDKYYGKS